ncbi:MAG: InlB B-repeat-containing protein [Clostridia bacterium]|nr:InlB B-repeat-containing protein [Clostridia bacterium]
MTKKRFLIAIAIVMVLILSVAVFVACNENQTKSYTVKFVDGESEIKSVSVEEGKTIADADIPADLTKDGYVFEGWYVGDVAFDKSAAITADVTYSAKWTKLHTVKFVDGNETIKTATVKDGEKLKDADVPADLTATGKAFEGWFDGTTAFDKDATITADKTFAAKWVGLFNVTFKNGEETIKVAQVKDGAVIAAADIPEDPTDDNYAFIGWFVGETAYDSSAAVTSDIVVSAKFSTIYKSYFGTWHGATDDWDAISYTVVVDATSITVTIGDADAQAATDIDVDTTDGTVMFKLGDTEYMLYANYDGNLCIYESSEIKLSAELEGRVHVSSTDIVGTYTTEGGHTIVINKTFAKVDDVLGVGFYYSESSGYSWSIGSNYSSLTFDSATSSWIYKENYSSDDDNVIVPELVAIDIPAEFIGNWYGTFESFGSTSYFLVKVTADGVFAYTPGSGFAKVGVATEYKDGKLTVVGLDETITASIADGKLAYKSDAAYGADCQLEKGTVVVFENNYSVFYIAKLGADNKIDQSTFALEDPQMEAGYTFKGWLSDLDYVTEFDESATFADSAVFVGSSEKTGYVVTFKKTSSDSDPVIAVVEKTNGKLAADQIPAALTYEDGSVFTGWYTSAGVKAVADLTISDDTTFIAKSVKESDYEGYWINTTSGKEALAIIADGKVTFGNGVSGVDYTFNAEDGSLKFTATISYMKHTYVVTKTANGISISDSYYDRSEEQDVSNVYELTAPKSNSLAKSCAGTYQCSNSEIIAVLENGIVTKYDGQVTTYGYISGTISNVKIVYKTGSSSSVTTKTGKYDAKSLVLGGKIYVKNPSAFASYFNSNNGTFYVYTREGKTTLYTYNGTSYATIDGELAIGNVVTVSYTDADGKAQSFVAKITSATAYDAAGAERGTFTAEGKDSIVFDGFGSATIGEKQYSYIINKHNIVVLKSDSETIGVTLDSEAKTYAEATGDGFAHAYIDESDSRYTLTFDGFGGVEYKYVRTYGSPQIAYGSYTLGAGSVTVKGADYFYDKTYSVEESGNVIVSTDGKKVLKTAGYVVESKIKSLEGYYVNGDSTIEIVVAEDKTFKLYVDGALVDAKANWNGSAITYSALDADAAIDSAKTSKTTFTISKDGDNIKVSHNCAVGLDMDGYIETAVKEATYTASTKPSAETDGLEGTYKSGSNVIVLDGKGNGTLNGVAFTYSGTGSTKQVSAFGAFSGSANTFTVTATGIDVSFDDEYQENAFKASFTKEAETLDAFAGTWKFGSVTFVFDGKGSVTVSGSYEGTYTYSIDAAGTTATFRNTAYSEDITCKLNSDGSMTVNDESSEWLNNAKFTKQA